MRNIYKGMGLTPTWRPKCIYLQKGWVLYLHGGPRCFDFANWLLLKKKNGFAPFFKFLFNFHILFIWCICISHWARDSVGKVLCSESKDTGSSPLGTKTLFFYHLFLIFFTNFNNFVHIAKLIILSWFFVHLSFNMSILWLLQKIPKIFNFWLFFI